MKIRLLAFITFVILAIFILSCTDAGKFKQLENKIDSLNTRIQSLEVINEYQREELNKLTQKGQYAFAAIKIRTLGIGPSKYAYEIKTSKIYEVPKVFSEDNRYRLIEQISQNLFLNDFDKIIDRKCYVLSSYAEASKLKQKVSSNNTSGNLPD